MKKEMTIGEKYDPIFKVETSEEATAYFEECVQQRMMSSYTRSESIAIEKANISHYARYGSVESDNRVRELFSDAFREVV